MRVPHSVTYTYSNQTEVSDMVSILTMVGKGRPTTRTRANWAPAWKEKSSSASQPPTDQAPKPLQTRLSPHCTSRCDTHHLPRWHSRPTARAPAFGDQHRIPDLRLVVGTHLWGLHRSFRRILAESAAPETGESTHVGQQATLDTAGECSLARLWQPGQHVFHWIESPSCFRA